ncbi:tetratricopeptide repeat protein [Streptomyces sp. NPDC049813]|uniref:tetratricopeptide repeat protein n=1 Tax=Streptomyces sp. NPDC049813 TaxID=3365597 RepID=UPI00378D0510
MEKAMDNAMEYAELELADDVDDEAVHGVPPAFTGAVRRRSPVLRRALLAFAAGCVLLGGVLVARPDGQARAPVPASPGPAGRAVIAQAAGAPASLPDLTALIAEREAGLRAHPRSAGAWAALGAAYAERGARTADPAYYPRAESALRRSLALRPRRNAAALDGLASLAAARGDWRGARGFGEAAVAPAPRRWTAYAALVDADLGLGDHAAAARHLAKLSSLAGGTAVVLRTAAVYRDQGRREDAAALLSDGAARAGTPTERAALLHLGGELAWERGDAGDALRYCDAALAADPRFFAAYAGQGRALASLGRTREAVRAYQRALAGRPEPQYALELGELYESLHEDRAARGQYDALRARAAARGARGVDDTLVLGRYEADHGEPAAAVARLRGAWARSHGAPVADALGWALHRAGRDGEAIALLRAATDSSRGGGVRSGLLLYHRGVVERRLGLGGAARRHLREAVRIDPGFSPLFAPRVRRELLLLGEPVGGGPARVWGVPREAPGAPGGRG